MNEEYAKSYNEFLQKKKITVPSSGFEPQEINPKLFQWQSDIVRWACKKGKAAIFADCGLGKGQPYGSKVLSPTGWIEIQDLKVGDKVISSDGNYHNVIGVYPKNEIDTYRFYYSDGVSCVFDKDHLHIVRTPNDRARDRNWRVLSTTEILNANNIRYGKKSKSKTYDIPVVNPINFESKHLSISPYIMGAFIGDGYIKGNISITNPDVEVIERIRNELPDCVKLEHDIDFTYNLITGFTGNKTHEFRQFFKDYEIFGKLSHEKFIPNDYLFSSVSQRLDLLRGLMDTDGYIESTCEYSTTSEQLANDVMFLIRSLGGIPTLHVKNASYYSKKYGHRVECKKAYRVLFSLKTFNPFYLSRKANKWNPNPRDNGRWINKIEYEKKQRTVCIAVDSPDHSYVTENMIVTHNTAMQLQWAKLVSEYTNMPVLILAPLAVSQQTKREGAKFDIEVNVCRTQEDVKDGINITNYEMLQHFDASKFSGIVLDESSILKHKDSKTRIMLTEVFEQTPYKLCCTATPAPNDFMELGTHAQFLGIMTQPEMLSTFFVHDGGDTSKWRLKGHAESKFFEWIADWACCLTNPSDLGYEQGGFDLPPLNIIEVAVKADSIVDDDGQYSLLSKVTQTLSERRESRRSTIYQRAEKTNNLARMIIYNG